MHLLLFYWADEVHAYVPVRLPSRAGAVADDRGPFGIPGSAGALRASLAVSEVIKVTHLAEALHATC
jgi:hypothetical protein